MLVVCEVIYMKEWCWKVINDIKICALDDTSFKADTEIIINISATESTQVIIFDNLEEYLIILFRRRMCLCTAGSNGSFSLESKYCKYGSFSSCWHCRWWCNYSNLNKNVYKIILLCIICNS